MKNAHSRISYFTPREKEKEKKPDDNGDKNEKQKQNETMVFEVFFIFSFIKLPISQQCL